MAKTVYLPLKYYQENLSKLIESRDTFTVETTSYTKKIKTDAVTLIFNEDGDSDYKVMSLINRVKKEANDYCAKNKIIVEEDEIRWQELIDRPKFSEISKVDLRSAYWTYAIKNGIISKETDDKLNASFDKTIDLKRARLKALGSLATKKSIVKYFEGVPVENQIKENTITRALYMSICRGVDETMLECAMENDGCFYYYWDCIFVSRDCDKELVKYIKLQGYETKIEECTQEIVTVGNNKYILTKEDNKMYIIKKENEHLL